MELRVYLLLLFPWLAGKSPLSLCPGGQRLGRGALVGQGSRGSSVVLVEWGLKGGTEGGNSPVRSVAWRPRMLVVPGLSCAPLHASMGLGHRQRMEREGDPILLHAWLTQGPEPMGVSRRRLEIPTVPCCWAWGKKVLEN